MKKQVSKFLFWLKQAINPSNIEIADKILKLFTSIAKLLNLDN